jgi:hypothetical protein
MARLAAILSSYLFFLVSCSGTTFLAHEFRHLGGQYMARGDTPDSRVIALASLPNPDEPGTPQITQFNLGYLDGFKKRYPQHSFLLPAGDGRFKGEWAAFFTSYKVKSLGPGRVEVETEATYDTFFAPSLFARYEATERDIKPVYTNVRAPIVSLVVGFVVALVLAIAGAVLRLIVRRRAGHQWDMARARRVAAVLVISASIIIASIAWTWWWHGA